MPEIAHPAPGAGRIEREENLRARLAELEDTHSAILNMLEDFDEERGRFQQVQTATLNLLEDMNAERIVLNDTRRAVTNILEDFDEERRRFQQVQTATLNLLADMNDERIVLDDTRRAVTNILEDVETERAKAEKARSLLEVTNRELEAFSYSVSHDLRAPLRAISGFAEAVLEDWAPRLDDEGRKYLNFIAENANKMGQLVDDLLAFSRLGRQQMVKTEINMGLLAKAVFDEIMVPLPDRKVELTILPVPPAYGDKAMIQQVLVNLFSNAVKFTRTRAEARVVFGFMKEGDRGAYYVKDNGVGFDMQYRNQLFGVFQRLHSAKEYEGTGVGLALAHRIITRHGGRVWAEGYEDRGATLYFSLPEGGTQ